ncbi:MAG: YggS family pyridoxal phosphate-dependent enzyme [Clostridia bacterium]|nr:YggS family pyridoxal phosphate-dependent enzyme [Clostridia bacterium]
MLKENLQKFFKEIENGNNLGEKITLVGATKFVDIERVNQAIDLGLTHIGENRAQEFRDKFSLYHPCVKHFIGTLQENKLKYVVGKADIIDSVSSIDLAQAIGKKAEQLGIVQKVMLEINAGEEENKTGASLKQAKTLYKSIIEQNSLELVGVMAMLPISDDQEVLATACKNVRDFYDQIKFDTQTLKYLSIGMSGDYKIAIQNGSNMIRIGSSLFGKRS